ncbi:hypothetical protein C8A00DRAFT_19055 [Chaetomidium leptoderma]|uniref:Uncharacterized protein n=1 Tax=Chaetomidium leptoderma TaxID=669021 RepID=A0AAN6VDB0_9PEZI|nr:hypothetical protein C8A00DRAFT_19055 [Chaetomidium leptoderma]
MEGTLSVPPDRGTIIGRAVWKVRYVVVGGANRDQPPPTPGPANRMQSNRTSTPRELTRVLSEGIFLSIYKSKEDTEPIQQHNINSISDCQVQMLAHRKQGPPLPTLVLNILPDPQLDKARKRRSSRTAGFAAAKETGPAMLLFRPGDDQQTLQEWARFIQQLIQLHIPDRAPLSPLTPASPTFINPFAPRSREPSDMQPRPGSGHGSRPGFFLKSHSQTQSIRDRPVTFSDSPSLRSKRSDLSSQTSLMAQSHMAFHNYTTMAPTDLPSPATTIGEYQGEFIEGWTSAQGRSSALSSPIRGRDSVSSQVPTQLPPIPDSGSAPGPRETILDRAFQLRCIPGSERDVPGEEKLTSLARFDALMRQMEDKRTQREAEEAKIMPQAAAAPSGRAEGPEPTSAFDEDDSNSDSDSDSDREEGEEDDEDDDSDGIVGETSIEDRRPSSTTAQRALDFITGRYEPTQRQQPGHGIRSPPSYNHDAFVALSSTGASSQMRPQTGYSKNRSRPGMSHRTYSQPHLASIMASSTPLEGNIPFPPLRDYEDGTGFSFTPGSPSAVHRTSVEKRQSAASAKRLSFTDFTRRLSSTSSLLLMQTNANSGGNSSRASNSDMDLQQPPQSPAQHLHHLHPRAGPPTPLQQQPPMPQSPLPVGERCGWRGSVGVFGGGDASGFL